MGKKLEATMEVIFQMFNGNRKKTKQLTVSFTNHFSLFETNLLNFSDQEFRNTLVFKNSETENSHIKIQSWKMLLIIPLDENSNVHFLSQICLIPKGNALLYHQSGAAKKNFPRSHINASLFEINKNLELKNCERKQISGLQGEFN